MSGAATALPDDLHQADLCVVGGGMAGVCTALAAARHGAKVVLMHDRPVLGGNASSECRVHICGADRCGAIPHMRETGILEELRLENLRRNPNGVYSLWDLVLYNAVRHEPNITLLLNCSCLEATMDGPRIASVTGWQLTTQTRHTVEATLFADCSGDAILAPLTGAPFRMGREGRAEFGESIAPETADDRTMGMSLLFQAKEYDTPQPFEPPPWAYRFSSPDELPYGMAYGGWWVMGYWWFEIGGEQHSVYDTEWARDELLKIVLGWWDLLKNGGDHGAANWAIDWLQFLPAKRESRRYIGDHVLTQNDIEAGGRFDDTVAYGGWPMDDHHPAGFWCRRVGAAPTIFHHAPSPYGMPLRSLYSRDIENLLFAGRCASATHAAMSSTRVMGTGCSMGQAVGTAAAMAIREGLSLREVVGRVGELQQALLADDCYIPGVPQQLSALTREARLEASQGDPEPVRDGISRQVGENPHCWVAHPGDTLAYLWDEPRQVEQLTLITDSAMDRLLTLSYHMPHDGLRAVPEAMARNFAIEGLVGRVWTEVVRVEGNYQRLVCVPVGRAVEGVRLRLDATWGAEESRVYGFNVE